MPCSPHGGGALQVNNQQGASGPWPHTRYLSVDSWNSAGAPFVLDTTGAPGPIRSALTNLLDDDLVGGVKQGGDFCLDIVTSGMLEVWVGQLSGGRFAAALFNRSPAPDSISLPWAALNLTSTTPMRVRDIWQGKDMGTVQGSYTATVQGSATAYLLLSPP